MNKHILLVSLLLSACAIGPNYKRPSLAFPDKWPWQHAKQMAPTNTTELKPNPLILQWWQGFNDPVLNTLIEEGLRANSDLQKAAVQVTRARAMLTSRQSFLFPDLGAEAGAARISNSSDTKTAFLGSKPYNNYNLNAVLNYEIDLWGKLRRAKESAKGTLLASQYNRDAIRQSIASEIASGYFNLCALEAQIALAEQTIKAREASFRYQEAQHRHGASDGLALKQAESELAAARTELPILKHAREVQENTLSVLLGRNPKQLIEDTIQTAKTIGNIPLPPLLPEELPSHLIERRPDVQAAEQLLLATNAEIGVAKADYFPSLSLSWLVGLESSDIDAVLKSSARQWRLGSNISAPIVNFGRTGAQVDEAVAAKEQALLDYQQAVRQAFKEVLDTMSAVQTATQAVDLHEQETKARTETLRLANLRYKTGYSSYLEVLDAERMLYQAQRDHIQSLLDRLTAMVNLYKALGGGWQGEGAKAL